MNPSPLSSGTRFAGRRDETGGKASRERAENGEKGTALWKSVPFGSGSAGRRDETGGKASRERAENGEKGTALQKSVPRCMFYRESGTDRRFPAYMI